MPSGKIPQLRELPIASSVPCCRQLSIARSLDAGAVLIGQDDLRIVGHHSPDATTFRIKATSAVAPSHALH